MLVKLHSISVLRHFKMSVALFEGFNLIKSKIFTGDDVITDNLVFLLHRTYTVTILVVFSILLSMSQVRPDSRVVLVDQKISRTRVRIPLHLFLNPLNFLCKKCPGSARADGK